MPTSRSVLQKLSGFSLSVSLVVSLAACGGGGPDNKAAVSATVSALNATLSNLSTEAGLASAATPASFDVGYMDAGYTRAMLIAALAANADALKTNPDLSLFPGGTLSNVVIAGCDMKNVCTMTATLTNSDADVTAVDFSTKVVFSDGAYRLLGDQAAA